jgi:inosine-uridine nucleoside N-ribohydrolase
MKVILDSDIGDDIDDAWALGYLIAHDGVDLLGVTMAHGNTPARAKIALKMLHLTGRDDVPVSLGRKTSEKQSHQYAWAEDFTATRPIATPAADFLVETARKYPGEVTLIAVGPLENVADAVRKEPALGKLFKRVVLMSGCIKTSRGGPCPAEYNVREAIADSQLVFGKLPLTIVPLDATTLVKLAEGERARISGLTTPLAVSLERLYRLWISKPTQVMTLHDQLAVVETVSPGAYFGRREVMRLSVDDRGYTVVDEKNGKPVTVCLDPKRDQFMEQYLTRLGAPKLAATP